MLASYEAAGGPEDPELARPLIGLATVNLEMSLYGKAAEFFERAISLLEEEPPAGAPRTRVRSRRPRGLQP